MVKFFDLLDRLVTAYEKSVEVELAKYDIYLSGTSVGTKAPADSSPDSPADSSPDSPADSSPDSPADPPLSNLSGMPRDAVILLCEEKGIEVPPRTRTVTLVSKLESFAAAGGALHDQNQFGEAEGAAEPKIAFNTGDPFGETPGGVTPAPESEIFFTANEVKAALQAHYMSLEVKDSSVIVDLLKRTAGVEKVKDIPENKFNAVMEALER